MRGSITLTLVLCELSTKMGGGLAAAADPRHNKQAAIAKNRYKRLINALIHKLCAEESASEV